MRVQKVVEISPIWEFTNFKKYWKHLTKFRGFRINLSKLTIQQYWDWQSARRVQKYRFAMSILLTWHTVPPTFWSIQTMACCLSSVDCSTTRKLAIKIKLSTLSKGHWLRRAKYHWRTIVHSVWSTVMRDFWMKSAKYVSIRRRLTMSTQCPSQLKKPWPKSIKKYQSSDRK